jgi:hypothetical protein
VDWDDVMTGRILKIFDNGEITGDSFTKFITLAKLFVREKGSITWLKVNTE